MTQVRSFVLLIASLAVLGTPRAAAAFCGFYVAGADQKLYNNATMVTLMRDGTTTVLSMRNNYQGPPADFAMVVPVPVVLKKGDVKTLPAEIFDRLDRLAAPRLVEYWEQDPCAPNARYGTIGFGSGTGVGYGAGSGRGGGGGRPMVKVEAQFAVGEYDIVILSAQDATALQDWLTQHGYKIPAGASAHLQPYVQNGWKFFVAKVDPAKVSFRDGMANLSPLRFHYESKDFQLPIRLGLINAGAAQDLIVHILAKNQRYEVANYDNATIPTNLIVKDSVREQFGEFYAALFDATSAKSARSVVTEYAWDSGTCDPCPDTPLSDSELMTLGLDVFEPSRTRPASGARMLPHITVRPTKVQGGLSKAIIHRFLRREQLKLKYCYEKQVMVTPTLAGTVKAEVHIEPTGVVSSAIASGVDPTVTKCMENFLRGTVYPKPTDGKKVRFEAQFELKMVAAASTGGMGLRGSSASGWVLTRLHARYSADSLGDDLVFRAAPAIQGGLGGAGDELSKEAQPAGSNMFQGRYIMRNAWTGAVDCAEPNRGVWGGPPEGVEGSTAPRPALDLAFAKRDNLTLAAVVAEPIAALGVVPGEAPPPIAKPEPAAAPASSPPPVEKKRGCGCGTSPGGGGALLVVLVGLLALRRRR